jgi:Sigma 54 modulation/S30EA ribosomal protein C terminus
MGEPFVFFANPDTGHASLLYHRYDGHYGLIDTDGAVLEQ